jgi:hypothetical protein
MTADIFMKPFPVNAKEKGFLKHLVFLWFEGESEFQVLDPNRSSNCSILFYLLVVQYLVLQLVWFYNVPMDYSLYTMHCFALLLVKLQDYESYL